MTLEHLCHLCVCVCVCERERERERECVCVCVRERETLVLRLTHPLSNCQHCTGSCLSGRQAHSLFDQSNTQLHGDTKRHLAQQTFESGTLQKLDSGLDYGLDCGC